MVRNTRSFAQALTRWARTLRGAIKAMLRQREPAALPAPAPPAAPGKPVEAPVRKRKAAARKPKVTAPPPPAELTVPKCPHCRKPMVIKTARTGRNPGDFWGCAEYPKCRGIRPIIRVASAPR